MLVRIVSRFVVLLSCLAAAAPGLAMDFPAKAVRFIVPFTQGTGPDRLARLVAEDLARQWKVPVVVENRLGASGHVGAQAVAQAPADGYAVGVMATNISVTAHLMKSDAFVPMRDLQPLLIAGYGDMTLVVSAKSPFNTLGEFLDYARANKGKLAFASAGMGSPSHIFLAQMQQMTGTEFLHVPYKGTAPAVTDLIGGQVDAFFVATHTVKPYLASGQLKALGVAAPQRNSHAADIPSFGELGVPGFSTEAWYGFMLPTGVPEPVAEKLYRDIRASVEQPHVRSELDKFGLTVRPSTTAQMREVVDREFRSYGEVIAKYNIKMQE
ncbi:tripartite tricarboxylate transporter substrate binding protein [Pigmentiphaga sp.]|uniref:Bug family tripartite tricarboxylate transporter substrate binding protein n=1 Tax=Pigmentiphaga sp. TaxID=1977564 RepID=UPI00128C7A75|nr:tripartite tricarboxylate transporter substrate binding protein [Pigmentiphaga sp.]MPS26506.1 tripartite tricarboxylate transporter substrate binding protein [Alcaligenaceae bacterium SAGV5]MPS53585.1 tripartite tricarboxylate transporter substrate binding protein [Alcaligenaceae bacterium SAGV3]MPT57379.1 tripartite tricarboxylate transporter substrate binding protein [Alcaligenaceae bacterium]